MGVDRFNFKPIVATSVAIVMFSLSGPFLRAQEGADLPVSAAQPGNSARVERLLSELKQAEGGAAKRIASEIALEWSKSGSPVMDLLLTRGRDALERGELSLAYEHLTALTDHAPQFAEGWHMRAMVLYRQDRYGLALHDLGRALNLEPRHFEAMIGLGAIFEQLQRPAQALQAYTLAAALYPAHEQVTEALGRLARHEGETL